MPEDKANHQHRLLHMALRKSSTVHPQAGPCNHYASQSQDTLEHARFPTRTFQLRATAENPQASILRPSSCSISMRFFCRPDIENTLELLEPPPPTVYGIRPELIHARINTLHCRSQLPESHLIGKKRLLPKKPEGSNRVLCNRNVTKTRVKMRHA